MFETARFSNEESRPLSANLPSHPSNTSLYKTSSNSKSTDLLVPASLASPPPGPPVATTPSGPPRTGRKPRKAISPNSAFDEYFKEGEKKSKEEDFAPATKSAGPPPPKMGGPPPARSPAPEAQPAEPESEPEPEAAT